MRGVRREENQVECAEEEVDRGGQLGLFVQDSRSRIGRRKGRGGSDGRLRGLLETRVKGKMRNERKEIVDEVVQVDVESLAW